MGDVQAAVRGALGRLFFPASTTAAKRKAENAERSRAWQAANKERVRARVKAYYEANRESIDVARRAWYEANKEKAMERARAWRVANLERARASRKARYAADPALYVALTAAWTAEQAKKNPGFLAKKSKAYRTKHPERMLLNHARMRARARGLEFNIELADVVIPTHCPVLGIPLALGDGGVTPGSPSLDRIDNSRGYVKGNVRVISHRANSLKTDATFAELKAVYEDACRLAKVDL